MYIRVDPSKTNGTNLWVMDQNDQLSNLKSNTQVQCLQGQHFDLPNATLIESQGITCVETASTITTKIYRL